MVATKQIIALAGCAAAVLLGCEGTIPERLNGKYEGYMPVSTQPGTDPIVARQLGMVTLDARPDGTADLVDQGIPIQGHLEYHARFATFVPEKFAGIAGNGRSDKLGQYQVNLTPLAGGDWMYAGKIQLSPKRS